MDFLLPLYRHQQNSVNFLAECDRTFDMSDAGTGKTAAHLAAWGERRLNGGGRLLVLAPKSILRPAWANEIKKFCPWFSCSVAKAGNKWKQDLEAETDILITNHDRVKALIKLPGSFWKQFDTIVIDESTAFKHHTSQRSKAVKKLVKFFTYRNCLSGTPMNASVTELWMQQFLLDDGDTLGDSFFRFRNIVQSPTQVGPDAQMVRWDDNPGALDAVLNLIAESTIRNEFDKCLDVPPNTHRLVFFDLSARHRKIYEDFLEESMLFAENQWVSAVNAAARLDKALQICTGAVYASRDGDYVPIDSDRYELIADIVDQRSEPVVVFFNWRHQRTEMGDMFSERGVPWAYIDGAVGSNTRDEIVADFQAGKIHVLLLHPRAAGHGLTLTRGQTTIWAGPIRQPDIFRQGCARIHRAGQLHPTETIMIAANDTFENDVYETLQDRGGRLAELLAYVDTSEIE